MTWPSWYETCQEVYEYMRCPNSENALEALFPGPRRLVFQVMFQQPERWWSLPELAGRAGLRPPTLRLHMVRLSDAGVVRVKLEGGRAWFQPDSTCPVYAELQALFRKLGVPDGSAETILVVEDQPATAQITRILLESWGYRVIEAHNGAQALEIFGQRGGGVQLLLADVLMPGITGPQLAAELVRRKPDLRVVFMSGYSNDQLPQTDAAFLPKPFNPGSLSRMIRRELDRPVARRMKSS
jgi:CheY-like chemotaxis protein